MTSTPPRLTFGLVAPPAAAAAAASEAPGVIARFDALAAWMRANGKVDLAARAAASYKELASSVRDGTSDIAWLPPVAYAWLAEAVTPLGSIAREGATTYAAALVVREDATIRALADLPGARAGWVDPWSAAGYVVPRLELVRSGIDPDATFGGQRFHGSHRDALLALQRGECDVVGTYARAPRDGDAEVTGAWSFIEGLRVRVLATFGSIPTDILAVRRNLPPREHERAARAFLDACEDATARPLVRAVFGGDELREGLEPGHDALRRAYETGVANGLFD